MKRKLSNVCYRFFSTLDNVTRRVILEKLNESEMNVTHLAQTLKQEQSMISHNFKHLLGCRFIHSKIQGNSMNYHINSYITITLFKTLENHSQTHCSYDDNCPKYH